MRELSSKFEGVVGALDVGTLSRRVRRENPDLTSSLTKRRSRQILSHLHRYLEMRVPRRPRSFTKRVKTDTNSKVGHHMPLCGYACSFKNLPRPHPTGAVRRVTTAKSLELLSSPHIIETIAPVEDAKLQKIPNKLAKQALTCDTNRTKARTPKCRPAFGCSRRALPGPKKENRSRLNL